MPGISATRWRTEGSGPFSLSPLLLSSTVINSHVYCTAPVFLATLTAPSNPGWLSKGSALTLVATCLNIDTACASNQGVGPSCLPSLLCHSRALHLLVTKGPGNVATPSTSPHNHLVVGTRCHFAAAQAWALAPGTRVSSRLDPRWPVPAQREHRVQ